MVNVFLIQRKKNSMKLWRDLNISQNVILTDALIKINVIKFSKDFQFQGQQRLALKV